jgi:thiamine transport system permease protein
VTITTPTLHRSPGWLRWTWLVPAAFLVVFLGVPLASLAAQIVSPDTISYFTDPLPWRVAGLATGQALLSTALALLLGLPMANILTRYRFPGRRWALALATVPFVLPTVVVALAFRALLGASLGSGLAIVVLAHAYLNLAVVVRIVGARWATIDPRFETAARTLRADRLTAFRTVTLPALAPAIASAAAIVFVFSFTSLGIVLLLGDANTRTLESLVLRQTSVLLDFQGAAISAAIQAAVVGSVLLWAARQRSAGGTLRGDHLIRPDGFARIVVGIVVALTLLIVLAPVAALVWSSLRSSSGWTLSWWSSVFGAQTIDAGSTRIGSPLAAMGRSLAYALLTGIVAAIVGGMAAVSVLSGRIGRAFALATALPLGISAATLGLGTLLAYGREPLDLRATGMLVPMAHALIAVPLVVAVATPTLRAADSRLVMVAASLGARPSRAWWTGYGPTLRTVMVAAGGLACAVSLGEFGAASFLARADGLTVPLVIARLLGRPGEASFGVAAVMAVILVVMTTALVAAVDKGGRRS